jgi:S1-C subfamily serine protease
VQNVQRGSSEAAAGVQGARSIVVVGNSELGVGGDLILAIDGQLVDREDALVRTYTRKRVGDVVKLTVFRNNKSIVIPMRLLRPPPDLE